MIVFFDASAQAASCLQLGEQHLMLTGDAAFERIHGLNIALLT